MNGGPPGGYGPRPGQCDETPTYAHERPAPVVVRDGTAPKGPPPLPRNRRAPTPMGGTLAQLGPAEWPPEEEPTSPRATPTVVSRLVRNYLACTPEDQRLIEALAIRLRPGVHG